MRNFFSKFFCLYLNDLEISLFCKQTGPKYVNKWLEQISLTFLYSPFIVETPELCPKKWPDFYLKLSRSISVKEGSSPPHASPNTLYTTIITNITGQRREERGVESNLWVLLSKFVKKKSPLFIAITQAKSTRTSIRQQSYQRRDT